MGLNMNKRITEFAAKIASTNPEVASELVRIATEFPTEKASALFGADILKLAGVKEAAKWEKLPKGWTEDSLKKFWDSMTGDRKHKITACMKKMEGKVSDPGAFCGGLASRLGER